MSLMSIAGDQITQSFKENSSELGYIAYDRHSEKYVLWLKDIKGDFIGNPGQYVRGGEWESLEDARNEAMSSPAAFLMHLKWMNSLELSYGFLAMQFGDPQLEQLAQDHIKTAIRASLGYEVVDVRDVPKAGSIDELIRNSIANAEFVIADLTDDNSGAYWEAGFAEGKGIPVIYVCKESVFERNGTHFDTNHLTTVTWSFDRVNEFKERLIETIKNTLD